MVEAFVPKDNKEYKKKEYWNERFTRENQHDWLARYVDIKDLISQYVSRESKILMVGCGNSSLSADMYNDGYKDITNIDFSTMVIANMQKQHLDKPDMQWIVADMLELPDSFDRHSFDVVIDKAAMDALMCDKGDVWTPAQHIIDEASAMCRGIAHVLKADGLFIQISFGQPHFRQRLLVGEHSMSQPNTKISTEYGWSFTYHNLAIGLGYFFYVLLKRKS